MKNVENTFTKTAENPNVNFYGNVTLGKDVSLKELKEAYHIVLLVRKKVFHSTLILIQIFRRMVLNKIVN